MRLRPSPLVGLLTFALAVLASTSAHAELKVADFFGDHMVLQRDQPLTIWGTADPGTDVSVSLSAQKATTKVDATGHWQTTIPGMAASGPFELRVTAGAESKSVKDIMVGDLWVIAGQSNVVITLAATDDAAKAKADPPTDLIRVCKLPGMYAFDPADSFSRKIVWDSLNPQKVSPYLSGVGYYFVRQIQPAVGVTIGLVQASAGGTQAEQWTPEAALKAAIPDNPLIATKEKMRAKLEADPTAKIGETETGANTLYNATIHPFRLAKLKGVVWYQGEANSRSDRDYKPVLETLVKSWREVFAEPDLPFVIIQLPKFGLPKDDGWMRVQEAQMLAAKDLNLPLVVTIDQGSKETIHPKNKAEVGRRAGLAALQHVYRQDVEGTSPFVKTVRFKGDTVSIEFDGFKGDLQVRGDALTGFELAGADGKFVPATASLTGRVVTVRATGVSQPRSVRYLWEHAPENVPLFSAAGLPAGPFRLQAP